VPHNATALAGSRAGGGRSPRIRGHGRPERDSRSRDIEWTKPWFRLSGARSRFRHTAAGPTHGRTRSDSGIRSRSGLSDSFPPRRRGSSSRQATREHTALSSRSFHRFHSRAAPRAGETTTREHQSSKRVTVRIVVSRGMKRARKPALPETTGFILAPRRAASTDGIFTMTAARRSFPVSKKDSAHNSGC
jgi:hypothetical protein